jgi:hypothetical protein
MRLADAKHNSFIEVKVEQGFFKMGAQVRLSSLLEMYILGFLLLALKILIWRRLRIWWAERKRVKEYK